MTEPYVPTREELQLAEESGEDQGYTVTLPAFEGPLDLLLHLIRKHKVDIYDIPITLITEQYNHYLDAMEQLDLDIAADYIYMAALLIHIKSKMLLPRDENDEAVEDPRSELVDRLIEYQKFRAVAESFAEMDVLRMGVWTRPPSAPPEKDAPEVDMSEVSLFDLIDAFRNALARYSHAHPQSIELTHMAYKVSDKMVELVNELATRSPIRLLWFLEGRGRGELVAIFLAMLELTRLGAISLKQSDSFTEILIHRVEKEIDAEQFKMYDH